MKKIALNFILVLCVIFSAVFVFTACGDPALKDNSIAITVANKTYDGAAIEVNATSTSGGAVALVYRRAEDPDVVGSYTTVAPTDAGDYVVVATTLETNEYKGAVARKEFTIAQKEVTVNWTAPYPLIYNGTEKMPTVAITGGVVAGDECNIEPQVKENNDNINAGNCTFVAVLSNSNYVVAEEAEKSYTITKAEGYIAIPNIGKDYNGQPAVLAANTFAGDFPGGEITIEYKVASAGNNTYTTTPFTNAGNYVVRVSISESNNYLACSSTQNFSINKINREVLRNKYKLLGEENWRDNNTHFNVGDVVVLGLLDDYGNVPEGEITFEIVDTIESTATGILNGNQLTITGVGNGMIRFCGHVAATTNYNEKWGNGNQGLTISKGTPAYTTPTGLVATYGQTLVDVELPAGFSWPNSANSVGNAGVNNFVVTYTPADTTNYNVVNNIPVTVTVSKANPVYEVPTGLVATYGDTLGSVDLPAGFNWFEDTTTSVGNAGPNTFHVSYCPADTDNYNIIDDGSIAVTITVAKANPVYEVPTGLVATYGDTLGSNILPEHFSWFEDTGTLLTTIGPNVYHVTYVPADTANYNSITDGSIAVTITVSKAAANVVMLLAPNTEFMYSGEPMEINPWNYDMDNDEGAVTIEYKAQGALDETYTTTAPTNLGNYVVRVSVAESAHYLAGYATAEFAIVKQASNVRILVNPSSGYTGSPIELTPAMYGYNDPLSECTAVVEYKELGAADNTYTTTAPTSVGQYVVRVTVTETAHCTGGVATTEFTIWGDPQVLQVSLNPSVEFIVDEGEVIAVSGLNANGNRMKEEVNFIGLTELEAIEAFIDYAKDNEFLKKGANEGAIAMNYSKGGFDLSALKTAVDSYLTGKDVTINTTTQLLVKADVIDIALTCLKEYTEEELAELNEEDILALIAQYRNDTKNFINPELEALYCTTRAYALTIAKYNAIMMILNNEYGATYAELSNTINEILNNVNTSLWQYKDIYAGLLLKSSNTLITMQSMINVYKSTGDPYYISIATSMETALAEMKAGYETMFGTMATAIDTLIAGINSQDYADAIDAYENDLSEVLNINHVDVVAELNRVRSSYIYEFLTAYGRHNHDIENGLNIAAEGYTFGVYADANNNLTYALNTDMISIDIGGGDPINFDYKPCYVYAGVHTAEELATLKPFAVYMYERDDVRNVYTIANETMLTLEWDNDELVPYALLTMEGEIDYIYSITISGYIVTITFNSNDTFYVFPGEHSKAEIESGFYPVMQVGDYTIENGVISTNEPGINMQFVINGEDLLMAVPGVPAYYMQGQFDLGEGLTNVTIVLTDDDTYYVCAGHITKEQAAAGAVVVLMGEYAVEGSTIILDNDPVHAPTFTIVDAGTGEIEMNI